jgi:hypothetical protein
MTWQGCSLETVSTSGHRCTARPELEKAKTIRQQLNPALAFGKTMSVDPSGLDIEERPDGSFSITAEIWWHGNRAHRLARMRAVTRRIRGLIVA